MIPIVIVNKMLDYVGELNDDLIVTQYHPVTGQKCYKINFFADFLWKIKSNLIMKRLYPIYNDGFTIKGNIELYKFGTPHYEAKLRINMIQ